MTQITIDYRFTSLNDYIDAERTNRYAAAEIKKRETEVSRLSGLGHIFLVTSYPVDVHFHWFRKDARTDPDNIQFGAKFILDGLVKAGILKGDSWKHIKRINSDFTLAGRDYVIVRITEAE